MRDPVVARLAAADDECLNALGDVLPVEADLAVRNAPRQTLGGEQVLDEELEAAGDRVIRARKRLGATLRRVLREALQRFEMFFLESYDGRFEVVPQALGDPDAVKNRIGIDLRIQILEAVQAFFQLAGDS